MNWRTGLALGLSALGLTSIALANVTFYEGEGFRGRAFSAARPVSNFKRAGFNDRASSVIVSGGRWEVCEDARFRGRCVVLHSGSYESLSRMGLNDRLSSARPVDDRGHYANEVPDPPPTAGPPPPPYEYRWRPNERTYQARVTSVHAVVGPPERRCWVEREQVSSRPNVGGAIVGGLIGGILGHQVGSGHGNDAATAGGAVVGAAVGANAGRGNETYGRDVRRCDTVADTTPDYWDVTYDFRGTQHRVQMSAPPGATITVNREGEPRQ
ncbi:MAG TPA: beta/gamma crystallin-related protein [Steroidobacteraceae bacterium]|nr:beta/gamma crystallin-related protein [Steroidobacteraceae bacterium]